MGEWISIKDHYPATEGWYLAYMVSAPGRGKYDTQEVTYFSRGAFTIVRPGEVTHWMPLPEPPHIEHGMAEQIEALEREIDWQRRRIDMICERLGWRGNDDA